MARPCAAPYDRPMKLAWKALVVCVATTGTALADDPAAQAALAAWPTEIIDRPLTLRTGMIRVQGDLDVRRVTTPAVPPATETSSATSVGLTASAGYGVSDQLE